MLKKLSNRFDQLYKEIPNIEATIRTESSQFGTYKKIDEEAAFTWKVKVQNLILSSCGKDSPHYISLPEIKQNRPIKVSDFIRIKSIFIAAMDDYKGGFLNSLKSLVQAETFNSELEQANELLSKGYKLAAAVIAGIVLETSLRDMCTQEGIAVSALDKMNTNLAKAGKYNKLQQKRITALADIRNSAAHGKPNEFTEDDVKMMIRDVERFLAIHLA